MSLCGMEDEEVLKKIKMQSQILFQCIADMNSAMHPIKYSTIYKSESEQETVFAYDTETMRRALYRVSGALKKYYKKIETRTEGNNER